VVFARKNVDVEPVMRPEAPDVDPTLRNEIDPDPLIEEMVNRLREGLSNLHAVDEWGRPLAWRNVVRLALGPLASRLRDTEQALELAVSMIPAPEEEPDRRVGDRRAPESETSAEIAPEPEVEAPAPVAEVEPEVDAPAAVAEIAPEPEAPAAVAEVEPQPVEVPATQATVDVILPAAEAVTDVPVEATEVAGHAILVEEPIEVDEAAVKAVEAQNQLAAESAQVGSANAVPNLVRPSAATSIFTVSGDQRAVAVSPLGTSELLSGSGPDDSTAAKYDRFLTGLYGERKQMSADEDRRSRSTGLGDNL
jgi:hypothetical protein